MQATSRNTPTSAEPQQPVSVEHVLALFERPLLDLVFEARPGT